MAGEGKRNRTRGFQFERDCVNEAKAAGFEAERMWGSDGQSKGLPSNVDIIIEGRHFQCKRKKRIAKDILPDSNIYGQVIRQDRDEAFVVIRYSDFLKLLKGE